MSLFHLVQSIKTTRYTNTQEVDGVRRFKNMHFRSRKCLANFQTRHIETKQMAFWVLEKGNVLASRMDIKQQTCFCLLEGLWLCKLNLLCGLSLSMCLITMFLCYIHIWWSLGSIVFKSLIEDSWRRSQLLTIKCHFQQQWSVFRETWSKHMVLKYPLKH